MRIHDSVRETKVGGGHSWLGAGNGDSGDGTYYFVLDYGGRSCSSILNNTNCPSSETASVAAP
jgi:hypothetical protein